MSAIGFKYKPSEKARSIGGGKRYALVFLRRHTTRLYPTASTRRGGGMNPFDEELGETQSVCHQGGVMQVDDNDLLKMRYIVRRLTPTEAERLMGLPSGWTIPTGLRRYFGADGEPSPELVDEFVERFDTFNAIMAAYEHKAPPKGKSRKQVADWLKKISDAETCPDSPRYKGCGNGQATNQPRWIVTRLLSIGEGIDPFTGEEL